MPSTPAAHHSFLTSSISFIPSQYHFNLFTCSWIASAYWNMILVKAGSESLVLAGVLPGQSPEWCPALGKLTVLICWIHEWKNREPHGEDGIWVLFRRTDKIWMGMEGRGILFSQGRALKKEQCWVCMDVKREAGRLGRWERWAGCIQKPIAGQVAEGTK